MEDIRMQIKAEAGQLCKMLSKPDSQRMPFEGVQIAKSLQRIPFLSKFFDMKSQQFINLCITSNIVEFQEDPDIYSSEQQRYIYIILQGTVKVTLNTDTNILYEQSTHYLNYFGIFGETQILFNLEQRKQKITALGVVKCMILSEEKIRNLINPQSKNFIERAEYYFSVNQYFETLTVFEKQQLVSHISLETFNKGDHLIQSGAIPNHIYFIIHGSISIVKQLKQRNKLVSSLANSSYQNSNKDRIQNIQTEYQGLREKYVIDQLSQMNSYGEFQCINTRKCQFYLIAKCSGSFYCLNYDSLRQSNHRILKTIKQKAIPYPDQQEIQFLRDIKNSLQVQQNKIVKKNQLF